MLVGLRVRLDGVSLRYIDPGRRLLRNGRGRRPGFGPMRSLLSNRWGQIRLLGSARRAGRGGLTLPRNGQVAGIYFLGRALLALVRQ